MLTYNTMRFLTDAFNPYVRQALLIASSPWDFTAYSKLIHFSIAGNEPNGSKRRFIFKIDGSLFKFDGQNLVPFAGTLDILDVLNDGNSANELLAVQNNYAIAGKEVFPIIALYTEVEETPSIKLSATLSNAKEILDSEHEHNQVFFKSDVGSEDSVDGKILGFESNPLLNGNSSVDIFIKLRQKGVWSDYMPINDSLGLTAQAFRIKYILHVDSVNESNSACLKKFTVLWSEDVDFLVFGDVAYLFSIFRNYRLPLKTCIVIVKHEPLDGATIDAYVAFEKRRFYVDAVTLAIASGDNQSVTIPYPNFYHDSLKLYADGVEFSDFKFNTADNSVSFTADAGKIITASFNYNADEESWLQMTPDATQLDRLGHATTRFSLTLEDNLDTTSGILLKLTRLHDSTTITQTATGIVQYLHLDKYPITIDCTADHWNFDSDSNILEFTHTAGQTVSITYSWRGSKPIILGWTAGWCV